MIRLVSVSLITSAFMVALLAAADDPVLPAKDAGVKKDDAPKKEPVKGDEKKAKDPKKQADAEPGDDEPLTPEKAKEIIQRLNKNLEASEDRLDKKDPGAETRKIQDQILKDLDELMKQQSDNNQSSSSSSGSAGSSSKSGQKGNSSSKSGGNPMGNSNPMGSNNSKGSNDPKGNKDPMGSKDPMGAGNPKDKGGNDKKKEDQAKGGNDPKEKKKDQAKAGGNDPKDKDKQKDDKDKTAQGGGGDPKDKGKGGAGMGGKDRKRETVSDLLNRDEVWGHLPQTKRLEMDAYSKERFMGRYEEILRQYYRTISEQNRLKDGE